MFYVVCVYIVVCGACLLFLPTHIPEERANRKSIFDKDAPQCPDDDIEKRVNEHLKDIPDLNLEV